MTRKEKLKRYNGEKGVYFEPNENIKDNPFRPPRLISLAPPIPQVKCPYCGRLNGTRDEYCKSCGAPACHEIITDPEFVIPEH